MLVATACTILTPRCRSCEPTSRRERSGGYGVCSAHRREWLLLPQAGPLRYGTDSLRRGFALAAALAAAVLISALLASFFFAVTEETRAGAATEESDRALAAAESAIDIGLEEMKGRLAGDKPAGSVETQLVNVDGVPAVVHATRLDSSLVWIVAVVGDPRNPAVEKRRIGVLSAMKRSAPDSITIVRITDRGWSELY